MGFWQRLANVFRKDSDAVGSEIFGEGWGVTASGIPINSFTCLQHSAVMACVSMIAEDVAKLPVGMFRRLPNGGKEAVLDHPLARVLDKPNNDHDRLEYIEMMTAHLVLLGNAYSVILRDNRGQITGLWPVHPDRVTLYEAPGGDYFFMVTRQGLHEMAVLRDMPIMIHQEDIFHLRWLPDWRPLLGTSRMSLVREAVGVAISMEQHLARVMGQGTRPGGALKTDRKLSKEAGDRVRASWKDAYGGYQNAGKTAILEEGLEYQQISMSLVDAQFNESMRFYLETIARSFRIPTHKLGLPVEGAASGLEQYEQAYRNDTLSGYTKRWIGKLQKLGDLDGREYFVEFDFDIDADLKTRLDAYRAGVTAPIWTPNEIRARDGLPRKEGGDDLLRPANLVPINTPPPVAGGGVGSDSTGKPAAGGDGDPSGQAPAGDAPAPNE